jgi:biotin carboxyl carrier protein
MKIISTINDDKFEIDIRVHPERENYFIAEVGGREVELGIIESKPGSLTLSVDGKVGFYEFHKDKGRIKSVMHRNRYFRANLRNRQQEQLEELLEEFGAGLGGSASGNHLDAPMPGKVLGINVKEGDKIELGQVLLVLEAMKMENEISSTVEGVVRKINCKVGDTVANGDVLIEVDPAS